MRSRDKRLPLDTWNTSGLQENVFFVNQFSTFDSPRDHLQGTHSCATQREQGPVPQAAGTGTLFTKSCSGRWCPHVSNRRRQTREGPELVCVCANTLCPGWHMQVEKGELTSCRGTVQSAWQKPPVRRKGGRTGSPARVSGRHVVR